MKMLFFKILKYILRYIRDFIFLPVYLIIGLLGRDKNLWLFGSWWGKLYSDNSRIFFEWINKNHPEIKTVWISKNKKVVNRVRSEGQKAFLAYSLRGIMSMIKAGKVFSSCGEVDFLRYFINGTDLYNLWHGMPLKVIFSDQANFEKRIKSVSILEKRLIHLKTIFSGLRKHLGKTKTTLKIVSNSSFFVPILANALQRSEDCILPTGSPRCDALFYNKKEPFIENLQSKFPGCKIIIYMPTFRTFGYEKKVFDPFVKKYGFNEKEFEDALERNNCVLLYKLHFVDLHLKKDKLMKSSSRIISISDNDYDELYNFIGQVDLLVSDYSSIYFDFIATKKPVILCPFDYEDYIKYSRAHYFDYFEHMEGVKARNWYEFIQILDDNSYCPVSEETRKKFAEYLDGNCCKKLFEAVIRCE